jgi:hypothetical protein
LDRLIGREEIGLTEHEVDRHELRERQLVDGLGGEM